MGVVAVAVVVLAVIVAIAAGEHLIKAGIESAGTKTLKVPVTVAGLNISVLAGQAKLNGLAVGNPAGYETPNLMRLDDGHVKMQIASVLSDTVNIKEIVLDGLEVTVEQKGLKNNLQQVIGAIPEEPETKQKEGKKLAVKLLEIRNTKVRVKLMPVPGQKDVLELKLAPIKMTDLGGEKKLTTAELAGTVMVAVAGGLAESGAGVLPDEVLGPITSSLDLVKNAGGVISEQAGKFLEAGKDIGDEGRKIIESGGDLGKQAGETLKGLFGGEEEKEN